MKRLIFAALALTLLPQAFADDVVDSLAPNTCKKPVNAGKMRRADDNSDYLEKVDAYKNCINTYVATQSDLARRHNDAANAAISDFNAFAKDQNNPSSP